MFCQECLLMPIWRHAPTQREVFDIFAERLARHSALNIRTASTNDEN